MRFPLLGSWEDVDSERILVARLYVAETFWQRFLGLQGLPPLELDCGLLLRNCSSIHTMWMRFAIDVFFLDSDFRVVERHRDVRPWRFVVPKIRGVKHVVEVASGIERPVQPGQRTRLNELNSNATSGDADR